MHHVVILTVTSTFGKRFALKKKVKQYWNDLHRYQRLPLTDGKIWQERQRGHQQWAHSHLKSLALDHHRHRPQMLAIIIYT